MARAARVIVMATAMKRTMVTKGDSTGKGYDKECSGRAAVATMAVEIAKPRKYLCI
jgi:hypothetical protein